MARENCNDQFLIIVRCLNKYFKQVRREGGGERAHRVFKVAIKNSSSVSIFLLKEWVIISQWRLPLNLVIWAKPAWDKEYTHPISQLPQSQRSPILSCLKKNQTCSLFFFYWSYCFKQTQETGAGGSEPYIQCPTPSNSKRMLWFAYKPTLTTHKKMLNFILFYLVF